jgi:hypothetical protein
LRPLWCWLILLCWLFPLVAPAQSTEFDPTRFMPIDQVKAGMVGVGKTVFAGTHIEEFQVEILGVLKKARPHGDIILVRVSGGPLAQTGVIQGMSGSPVYIEGRLIGAMAYGWPLATEPLSGLVPIGEMLHLWQQMDVEGGAEWEEMETPGQLHELQFPGEEALLPGSLWHDLRQPTSAQGSALMPLETPVMLSGFDQRVVEQMAPHLKKYNLVPIQAGSAADEDLGTVTMEPGATLAVQLVSGDVSMSAIGTLTHREGDRIMGFGHPMFYAGDVDFPMTGAYVHSIMPSQLISFKLASVTKRMGVLRQDRRAGVAGIIGREPSLLPINLAIHHGAGTASESYFFEVIDNKFFSPNLVAWTTLNALLTSGTAMGDATLELDASIAIEGYPDLQVENLFAGAAPQPMLATELSEIVGLLLRNNLEKAHVQGLTVDISVENRRRAARIFSARADKRIVQPGEKIQVTIFLEPYRAETQTLSFTIPVPEDAPEGRLALKLSDAGTAMAWEHKRAPNRFQFQNLAQLLDMLRELDRNDQLIAQLVMARSGAVIRGQELPSLPPSALAVLRGLQQEGEGGLTYEEVLEEKKVSTDYVLSGQIVLPLTVRR